MICLDQMTGEVRLPLSLIDKREQCLHDESCDERQCSSTQVRHSALRAITPVSAGLNAVYKHRQVWSKADALRCST